MFYRPILQGCPLFISTRKHQVASCVVLPICYLCILFGCCPHHDLLLLLFSFLFPPSIFSHFTATHSLTPQLHPRPAILLSIASACFSLSRSIILASHSERSSASQIDFAAVLRSPINSEIGFPAYPLPLALCLSFSLSQLLPLFSPVPVSSLLAFCLITALLSRSLTSLSFSDTFPLFLSLYAHSYLSSPAEVSYY